MSYIIYTGADCDSAIGITACCLHTLPSLQAWCLCGKGFKMLSSLYSVMQKFIRLLVVLTLVCKLATANLHYSYSGDPPDSPSSTPPSVNATSGVSSELEL